jgi:hypothetical protein
MMEAVQTSETLVNSYQPRRCYNPEDSYLQHRECLDLGSKRDKVTEARENSIIRSLII